MNPTSITQPGDGQPPSLLGSRCKACDGVVFPRMPVCPACGTNGAMEDVSIGRTARLFSHTIAYVAPKGFVAPFYQAFVDLPEGPRIFTLVGSQCPVERGVLKDGMEMRLVFEPLADTDENRDRITYKYLPAGNAGQGRSHA